MARSGLVDGKPELLDGPCGPPWDDLENHSFHYYSIVWSSWAPPGFSRPYFRNYMKITVFIVIVTPNELLNSMIFSCVLQITNYRKNKENMNSLFFICISSVLSSGAPPMHMFFSIDMFKEICRKRTCENT